MASKLNERDKRLLDGNLLDVVGNKPYENGKWGTQAEDFVYLELFDNNNNLIEYTNLPVSQFVANTDNNNVEFFPGTHIRNLGFESGIFTVRYNFLRKLAGDESAVLLHTIDKVDTKIGDVYTNADKIYITDDGIVYNVTEQEYKDNPTVAEQLAVEDLRYQIDEISPSRTEVRLKAKKINSAYIDQFISIQTKNKYKNVTLDINFTGDNRYESKILTITPNTGDFLFTQQMVKGTLTLPDVYKVDEIEDAVRSGINIVENGTFENIQTTSGENGVSSIVYYGDKKGWDPDLHEEAVLPIGWQGSAGFRPNGSFGGSNIWDNTEHIGYHAKVVQNEGIAGGNCLKFTDNNEIFESSPEWPTGYPYRLQIYGKYGMPKLSGLGVKGGDYMNIRMDIRSTVPGKGIQTAASYPNELLVENEPQSVPEGYFNPESPGPNETMPSSPPPGYQANTADLASMMWPQPASTEAGIIEQFDLQMVGFKKKLGFKDPEVGDTTFSTTIGDPYGSWIIQSIFDDSNPEDNMPVLTYSWAPNMSENLQIGALSPEEEWTWNGTIWVASPNNTNVPTPPENTVNNINAVNHHPYVVKNSPDEYMGKSYYPRKTKPGQNRGWQTGTFLWDVESDNGEKFNNTTDGSNGSTTTLLFKDDLVWGTEIGSESSETINLWEFDALFPDVRNVIVNSITNKTLYDDIFEKGFIQSVTRTAYDDGSGTFLVFYNNGDTLEDGLPHPNSNKWFRMRRLNNYTVVEYNTTGKKVHLLSEINELLNDEVLASPSKFEVAFCNEMITAGANYGGNIKPGLYFFTEDNCHYFGGGTSVQSSELLGINMDDTFTYDEDGEKFKGLRRGYFPDVMIGRGPNITEAGQDHRDGNETYFLAYSRSDATKLYRTTKTSGANYYEDINEVFFNVGSFGIRGYNLTYGVRNPAATNSGPTELNFGQDQFFGPDLDNILPVYENVTPTFDFDINPLKIGALSPQQLWKWTGYEWVDNGVMPPRYNKTEGIKVVMAPSEAGIWETIEISVMIPADWILDQNWSFYIYGNNRRLEGTEPSQGIVWVDNVFIDFTYTDQSETRPVMRPYKAQITSVSEDGKTIQVDKSYMEVGIEQGQQDIDGSTPELDFPELPEAFDNFYVTYFNLNPKDLRTYLKFDNQMFLTTNFKQDVISVTEYPNSIVYKMYEPLPADLQQFDECIVVKEMANPMEESINIVDFIPEENPRLVLKSPDLKNVESPVQVRTSQYKTESDILTTDTSISNELRNKFISQSLDSVELNTDYSRYENFVNFGSAEKRIRNFKLKLENIESYKISSASYVGVSGSAEDLKFYHSKIEETKNNLDSFENYMYFESSSYQSGSLGQFYDNSWPKTSGDGTSLNPYVLAHTTSSQATNWFSKAITSSSLYDNENNNKLSGILPEFIKYDESNKEYLTFTDMIGQHFDSIWEYINSLSDVYDRRDKLDEGLSKDLIYNVAKSLGWNLDDGKDLVSLPRYALGKEVTGSAYSDYSAVSEKDMSREIWGRIVNNMPFFLKNKGTVRALKGLINIYGIPSTILRVKEYGGPNVPDNETPQYEITRKFTKALDFRGGQSVKTAWANDGITGRKPDTIEFRFRAATGSNQILVEKQDGNNQDFFIRLKDNGSTDNYGFVSFMLSGSAVGQDIGQYKEISSSALPIYDGDFYSVMVARTSGSSNTAISQSYQLNVGKYDSSRSKIHLYSTSTMDVTQAASSSFSNAWTGSGDIFIGGQAAVTGVGARFSGSIMEYRHWTETLNTGSFKNHTANPKAYDGNSVSSSYNNLVLRYSFDDNKNLSSDTAGIRDISANQQSTYSGSHSGFTGNFFRSVVDELKTHIPSIGALRRSTNKVRIESNPIKAGNFLSIDSRATDSAYDTAPNDSNKVGVFFAPTDVINNDIINSVGDLNFDNYLGDPRDQTKLSYNGLNYVADNYWKKYTAPNNFWDYIRLIKYYDQSLYPQLRKLIPARAKPDIGLLIEPNIFERPKVVLGKTPDAENIFYSSSIDIGNMVDGLITITGSYNHGSKITDYESYDGKINVYSYETGSSAISSSGEYIVKEASGSEIRDSFMNRSIWQTLGQGSYSYVTMSKASDTLNGVKGGQQDFISGSRIYGINQETLNSYSSSLSASLGLAYSSSFKNTDLDNFSVLSQGLRNSFYEGVKNSKKTTSDSKSPIEVIISAPTKLVTTEGGDSTLDTGDGIVPDFKEPDEKDNMESTQTYEQKYKKKKKKRRGLKGNKKKYETDMDRKKKIKLDKLKEKRKQGKLVTENYSTGETIPKLEYSDSKDKELEKEIQKEETQNSKSLDISNDGIDDGVLNMEK
jgi:hypothetical protein